MTKRKISQPEGERPRGGRARSVADMLPDIGGTAFRRFGFVQSAIVTRWPEIVGPRYADVCAPESIRFPGGKRQDGVLSLMVDSAHAPMVQHVAPAIVERVNRFFGYAAVAKLAIRQGSMPPPAFKPKVESGLRPVPVELSESLRSIADPELRACLGALAGAVAASTGIPVLEEKLPRIS